MRQSTAAAVVALAAAPAAASLPMGAFRSQEWGLTVRYPNTLKVSQTFKANYMDRGAWRVSYAAGTGSGARIVALSLPDIEVSDAGGTSKATAELRIGASSDPGVVEGCLTYGMM